MTIIAEITDGGFRRAITIDGTDIEVSPNRLSNAPNERIQTVESLAGDTIAILHALTGEPDKIEKYRIEIPYDLIEGEVKKALQRLAMKGGNRTLCIWTRETAWYTAAAAQIQFLLPQKRQNAGTVHDGLIWGGVTVSTTTVPFKVWIDDVLQAVNYENGPTVVRPAAGEVTVGRDPILSGLQKGYVEFRVGDDLAGGEVIEIEYTPVLTGRLTRARVEFPISIAEGHAYLFQES